MRRRVLQEWNQIRREGRNGCGEEGQGTEIESHEINYDNYLYLCFVSHCVLSCVMASHWPLRMRGLGILHSHWSSSDDVIMWSEALWLPLVLFCQSVGIDTALEQHLLYLLSQVSSIELIF